MTSFVNKRRTEILSLLEKRGSISTAELAEHFDVSQLTIRRDLAELEKRRFINRSYGLASLVETDGQGYHTNQAASKLKIAKMCANLVEDGDTIFINTSSTALAVIEFIKAKNVTIITNSGRLFDLEIPSGVTAIMTGGEVRVPKWSMSGEFALHTISQVTAHKCILGCSGLSHESGLTTMVSQELPINTLMLKNSRTSIVVCDSSKIGYTSSFSYGSPDQIDTLVTDEDANATELLNLKKAGVKHIIKASH